MMAFAKDELNMTFDDEAAAIDCILDLLEEQSKANTLGESYEWDEPSTDNPSELTEHHSP